MSLEEDRSKAVKAYRANKKAFPDGIGAWFFPGDWDKEGKLVATGEDRVRALDPWANDRAKGLPCPKLGSPWPPKPSREEF